MGLALGRNFQADANHKGHGMEHLPWDIFHGEAMRKDCGSWGSWKKPLGESSSCAHAILP